MKKLFKKPVMDVLYFDEEDIVLEASNGINLSETDSNTEIASEGLDTSVLTVERASAIFN